MSKPGRLGKEATVSLVKELSEIAGRKPTATEVAAYAAVKAGAPTMDTFADWSSRVVSAASVSADAKAWGVSEMLGLGRARNGEGRKREPTGARRAWNITRDELRGASEAAEKELGRKPRVSELSQALRTRAALAPEGDPLRRLDGVGYQCVLNAVAKLGGDLVLRAPKDRRPGRGKAAAE